MMVWGQAEVGFGFLPSVNINKKLPKDWAINFKTESRQAFIEEEVKYEYLQTDISLAASKKISLNSTIAAGYLLRIEGGVLKHRSIQQLNIIDRNVRYKLAHRFSTDQTFDPEEANEYRLRYRISAEIPMSGESLDVNEFFVKLGNEYLNAFSEANYDLEIRALGFLGYVVSPRNKVELGVDYRIDSFISNAAQHQFWAGLNFYLSI
ncbi:hypothetical protein PEDI_39190 [Persicobacter diffluens]|uniref:DUF2490 domain-containing protein n=2 Tax=Persicobacter diffluens TaxID=981 RepID=A0AAN4W1J2_9BACT|nr:hypothetical protein PEDI_39190 [Persicobacter diffluens]